MPRTSATSSRRSSQRFHTLHPLDEATMTLHLTNAVFLRSSTWARWPLGIAWPVAG
jgi:hypothetical protein